MNIPDEVLTKAFGGIHFYEPYYSIHLKQAQVIAEWARKEALKESATEHDALRAQLEAMKSATPDPLMGDAARDRAVNGWGKR